MCSRLLVHHNTCHGRPEHPTRTLKRWGGGGAQQGAQEGHNYLSTLFFDGAGEGHKRAHRRGNIMFVDFVFSISEKRN